ncbi:MAG: GAF domain-containing protein [Filimonas sp.]|nr:GAF domain-containing protein [Filimonas sp.]
MKVGKLYVEPLAESKYNIITTTVSFKRYIRFLEEKVRERKNIKSTLYRFILRQFERHPELYEPITDLSSLTQYEDILELVQDTIIPLVKDENKSIFALSAPLSAQVFYCSDAFYTILQNSQKGVGYTANTKEAEELKLRRKEIIYGIILGRLYDVKAPFLHEVVINYNNPQTGLTQYFRLEIDASFVDINFNKVLPQFSCDFLTARVKSGMSVEQLEEILPLEHFALEGFSIVTATDVTQAQAIENIKNILLSANSGETDYFSSICEAIKTLLQQKDLTVGFLPFLEVNGEFVTDPKNSTSILFAQQRDMTDCRKAFETMAQQYVHKPKALAVQEINAETLEQYPFLQALKVNGSNSYLVLPVYYSDKLVGAIELASPATGIFDNTLISRLDTAIPLVAQLLKHRIDEFNADILDVIREKFTSMQPAVQWRFNEVAWDYIKHDKESKDIANITFNGVYPLYGAIDIRNSSIERNAALKADLEIHFNLLSATLNAMQRHVHISLLDEMLYKSSKWMQKIGEYLTTDEEIRLSDFFENEVRPFLQHFQNNYTATASILKEYFKETNPVTGSTHANRRRLENSIQLINTTVGNFLEKQRDELQKVYPNYFEKFRTDGIEYDIYIGQSISPNRPFDILYLKNLRLWQIASMAKIARITNQLVSNMETPLYTTQLILAHNTPIDISFRTDERRFDVEGAYNIRYEVVKKRIDKVHIRDTNERLTTPGTISIVYYNDNDARELKKYIQYLQEQRILLDNLEQFNLEDLQGVSGLKAIRVGVNLDMVF